MNISLRTRVLLAGALALAALALVSREAWRGAEATEQHLAASQRSERKFDLLDAAQAHVAGAEAAVRAYAISGRGEYLAHFDSARTRVPILLDRLASLTAEGTPARQAVDGLRSISESAASIANLAVDTRQRSDSPEAAESVLASAGALETAAELRSRVSALRLIERKEIAARADQLTAAARRARYAVLILFSLSLGILASGTGGLAREVARRERDRVALAESETRLRATATELRDLYDHAPCGYLTIDRSGRITRVNDTALRWLGLKPADVEGRLELRDLLPADERTPLAMHLERLHETGRLRDVELDLQREDGRLLPVHLSASAMTDEAGAATGARCVVTDRTALKLARDEQQGLIETLEEALTSVKTLSGLLPICSTCRKIRDDQGYWKSVESYLSTHTDARLSHGVCPDCFPKMFPGVPIDG